MAIWRSPFDSRNVTGGSAEAKIGDNHLNKRKPLPVWEGFALYEYH